MSDHRRNIRRLHAVDGEGRDGEVGAEVVEPRDTVGGDRVRTAGDETRHLVIACENGRIGNAGFDGAEVGFIPGET